MSDFDKRIKDGLKALKEEDGTPFIPVTNDEETNVRGEFEKRIVWMRENLETAHILSIEDYWIKVIAEAKKEFPLTNPAKERCSDFWSELASERLQWFKKWFSVTPHQKVPF